MPSAATNPELGAPFQGSDSLRDDLVRAHLPANEYEKLLVTQIARTWLRHQQALDLESEIFAKSSAADLFANHLDRFKAIARYVAETERMWRHALDELRRAQRTRASNAKSSSHRGNISMVQPIRPEPAPAQNERTGPPAPVTGN